MSEPRACPECLRRAWLLALLGPYMERVSSGAAGSTAPELLRLDNEDLVALAAPQVADQLLSRIDALSEQHFEEELTAARCWATCRHHDLYPDSLRDAADAPWALIGRGDHRLLDGLEPFGTVTIVGARRATSYGREIAHELGGSWRRRGWSSSAASPSASTPAPTAGALDAGRTIAVLGCGPTSPIRPRTARSGGGSASRAWSSPSSRPAPRPGAGPSRPATGSWRRWPG